MWPKISVLIPTLNAGAVLENCLSSVKRQNYPKEQIEIVIADGGSSDATLDIARKYDANVVENKLKTGEAGKMAALRASSGEFVALIDSDNVLPDENWLQEMVKPLLNHAEAVGSEPWRYTWRKEDGFIDRYCALIGMNDPLCHFLGNYDRINELTGKWTEVPHEEQDMGVYLLVKFDSRGLPTIGANGTVFRSSFLKSEIKGDYLFDIDILAQKLNRDSEVSFIKVKNGIIHNFCGSDVAKFSRKQKRRIKDFLYHSSRKDRNYTWTSKGFISTNVFGQLKFVFYCVTVFPLLFQSVFGYLKKRDTGWFFHIPACEITLFQYSVGYVSGIFKKEQIDRKEWRQ